MQKQFEIWLKNLKKIWEDRTPEKIVDLCSEKFLWYETPFDKSLRNKKELLEEWRSILKQKNIRVSYRILSVNKNVGLAKWNAKFDRFPSKQKVELDGIFRVVLDQQGKCKEFRQWYNSKV